MNGSHSNSNSQRAISWASGINLILGLWLFVSSWALAYQMGGARWNNIIIGLAVVVLSWIRLANRSRAGVASWLNGLLGLWLIIAPFAMHDQNPAQRWNDVIIGIVVLALAIVSGSAGASHHQPTAAA